jgi:hypothetical protein
MEKKYSSILAIYRGSFKFPLLTIMPQWTSTDNVPFSEFKRAYATVAI